MNLSLSVFLLILEAVAASQAANELLGIIHSPKIDYCLFSIRIADLKLHHHIFDLSVTKRRHS